jgi:hypothetical protein
MLGPLVDQINEGLPWLASEFSFRVTDQAYDYKGMGSSYVVLQSDSIHLKFIRDRGPVQLQVAAPTDPERWLDLGFLWFILTGHRPEPELEAWARFFREHVGELSEALGPRWDQTRSACEKKQQAAIEHLTQRLPRRTVFEKLQTTLRNQWRLGWIIAAALLVWLTVR